MRKFSVALFVSAILAGGVAHADVTHVVERGQTLTAISKRYGVTVDEIRKANGLFSWQQLKPGQELEIPGVAPAADKAHHDAPTHEAHPTHDMPGPRATKGDGDYARRPKQPGVVHLVRGDDHFDAQLVGRHGKLNPAAVGGLGKILRFYPTGAHVAIDPRLAALIAKVSDHFGGRTIHVVSGFRPYSPTQYTPHSNHNHGRAMDFNVEGIPNEVLRDYCRSLSDAGVGYYPNSSFVHLDTRTSKTFWIDYSRPHERPKYDKPGPNPEADDAPGDVAAAGD